MSEVTPQSNPPAVRVFEAAEIVLRAVIRDGEPWFVAADVARALGYSDATHAVRGLDDDEKGLHNLETLGGEQRAVIVSEAGLYTLIIRSRVEGAKRFKRWVTHDVLPSIRRTGSYGSGSATHLLLSDTASEWKEMWKRDIHDAFCELYGKPKTRRNQRFVGNLQAKVYKGIAGDECYAEMKRRIPNPRHGKNLHQLFSERARDGFGEQLAVVLGILKTSHSPADFWDRFEFLYANRPMQLPMGVA